MVVLDVKTNRDNERRLNVKQKTKTKPETWQKVYVEFTRKYIDAEHVRQRIHRKEGISFTRWLKGQNRDRTVPRYPSKSIQATFTSKTS